MKHPRRPGEQYGKLVDILIVSINGHKLTLAHRFRCMEKAVKVSHAIGNHLGRADARIVENLGRNPPTRRGVM